MIQLNPNFSRNRGNFYNREVPHEGQNKHKNAYIILTSINTICCLGQATSTQSLSKIIHTNAILYSDRNRVSKMNKKIPSWIKLFFKLLFGGIVVLNLLGVSILLDLTGAPGHSTYNLRLIIYTISSLSIIFQLLNLYFLHKFYRSAQASTLKEERSAASASANSNAQSQISEVLPNFIIKWLKGIEIMSSTKEGIQSLKENCYIEISIYIVIIIIVTLIS